MRWTRVAPYFPFSLKKKFTTYNYIIGSAVIHLRRVRRRRRGHHHRANGSCAEDVSESHKKTRREWRCRIRVGDTTGYRVEWWPRSRGRWRRGTVTPLTLLALIQWLQMERSLTDCFYDSLESSPARFSRVPVWLLLSSAPLLFSGFTYLFDYLLDTLQEGTGNEKWRG